MTVANNLRNAASPGWNAPGSVEGDNEEISALVHRGDLEAAAVWLLRSYGVPNAVSSEDDALIALETYYQQLCNHGRYDLAARLLWTRELFDPTAGPTRTLFRELSSSNRLLVPGASSMGKSYSLGAWMYLDWRRDPEFTNIKIVGPSEQHLETNIFSHVQKLHRASALPGPGDARRLRIVTDPHKLDCGIFGLVVPRGVEAAGVLQGLKALPRSEGPHPVFGPLSRVRVMLEEAENIPVGIWKDVENILSNVRGPETFKIVAPFNPRDRNTEVGFRVEPEKGWESVDIERDHVWDSVRGWRVCRLDGYQSPNYLSEREVVYGMQTREGIETILRDNGGVGSPAYFTMVRGWYPLGETTLVVIPGDTVVEAFGEWVFEGEVKPLVSLDVALEGGDEAVATLGRAGIATHWRRQDPVSRELRPAEPLLALDGAPVRRWVVQADAQIKLSKGSTIDLAERGLRLFKNVGVPPERVIVDKAGMPGVYDYLTRAWSAKVLGFNGSMSCTDRKILAEDREFPGEKYQRLGTEAWFAVRYFFEAGVLLLGPGVNPEPLMSQLTSRRFHLQTSGKSAVESKKEYKTRLRRKSPDEADSLILFVHAARVADNQSPSLLAKSGFRTPTPRKRRVHRTSAFLRPDRLGG